MVLILPIIKIYFEHFLCSHFGIKICTNCPLVFQPWDCQNWQARGLLKETILYTLQILITYI